MYSLPLASLIIKSFSLFLVLFLCVCNIIKVDFQIKKFIIYMLILCFPLSVFFFYKNFLLYFILSALFVFISIKVSLKIEFKLIAIPLLLSYCFYQLVVNSCAIILQSLNILQLIFNNIFYFAVTFAIAVPIISALLLYTLKNHINDHFLLDGINTLSFKLHHFILTFLTLTAFLLTYVSPYYTVVVNNLKLYNMVNLFNLFIVTTLILIYIYIKDNFSKHIIETKNQTLIENSKNIENLNKELRALRHDFLNHLQVISGMLQLKKHQECLDYILGISSSCYGKNSIKAGLICINALLNSKQLRARNQNIRMDFDILSQLDSSTFKVEDWEITNILGNLIDNAIYEESKVSTLDKYINIKINENYSNYTFCVYNKNSYIPNDKKNHIFGSGYSTKGKDGHGMGLYIAKKIVDKYQGNIHIDSNIQSGTAFSIHIPKYNPNITKTDYKSYPPQESLSTQIY